MRIDLVCSSIYGNVENIDILLNINNINEAKSGKINLLEIQDGIDQVEFGKATPAAGKAAYVSLEKANLEEDNQKKFLKK